MASILYILYNIFIFIIQLLKFIHIYIAKIILNNNKKSSVRLL